MDTEALGVWSMCSGDKLILTKTGMNTLVNLLKGLMGPETSPPCQSYLVCDLMFPEQL